MPAKIHYTSGQRFAGTQLTFVKEMPRRIGKGRSFRQALFDCDCGGSVVCDINEVTNGGQRACGCIRTKHGMSKTPLYGKWWHMRNRCDNPEYDYYMDYGGRDITYCDEWKKFVPFYEWSMANGYSDELELDREDNDGNYEPDNCRYVIPKINKQNSSQSKYWHINDVRYDSKSEAGEALGKDPRTIAGWCNGYTDKGKYYPPKSGCWSELKYTKDD